LVAYQNLPTSHIWLAKFLAAFFAELLVTKTLAWQILVANQADPKAVFLKKYLLSCSTIFVARLIMDPNFGFLFFYKWIEI
jgi:hypothetical protein